MVLTPSRERLAANVGRKIVVHAVYVGLGKRKAGQKEFSTVLIRDVRQAESGELLTDHLWFNRGKTWRKAGVLPGDRIAFEARSIEYRTGYWGPNQLRRLESPPRVEYKLTAPAGLRVLGRNAGGAAAA